MRKHNKSWYKPKGYLHFSPRLKEDQKDFVLSYIEEKLDTHNFFPLIHETLIARRYKAYVNDNEKIYRSHYDVKKNKSSKKPREIFYANHLDAHIYAYFSNEILGKKYEALLKTDPLLSASITAYRRISIADTEKANKCNIHFAKDVFMEIKRRETCIAVCYDIENFFPSLNHEYLETCWKNILCEKELIKSHKNVLRSLTKYSFVEMKDIVKSCSIEDLKISHKNDFLTSDFNSYFLSAKEFRDKIAKKNIIRVPKPDPQTNRLKGIPQGTPISAFLANLYLLEFDNFIVRELVEKNKCFYRRYSDDIVIIFENQESFHKWNTTIIDKICSEPFYLKINPDKTVISEFSTQDGKIICNTKIELSRSYSQNHSLKYLGFEYDGEQILLKSASLAKFYRDMKMAIRRKFNRADSSKRYNNKYPLRKKKDTKMYLTKLYSRFTHLGKNKSKSNYLTYVDRAAKTMYPDLNSENNPISRQIKRAWSIFGKTVKSYEDETEKKGE